MMKIVAIIQARMRSTRLPGKVLLPILGRPMLELMIERLKRVKEIDEVVIATSTDPTCEEIEELAQRLNVKCFRGSEEDVLDRVVKACRWVKADLIVETTGDCPLIDPEVVSLVIKTFLSNKVDYCSNILERTYPRGLDTQVFPLSVLEEVATLTQDPVDREHVSIYIYTHPERYKLLNVKSSLLEDPTQLRLTVDTPEDFQLIRKIYEYLYPKNSNFVLSDIFNLCRLHPELPKINYHIQQKVV